MDKRVEKIMELTDLSLEEANRVLAECDRLYDIGHSVNIVEVISNIRNSR